MSRVRSPPPLLIELRLSAVGHGLPAEASNTAGLIVHACRLANSIIAGARKPGGKITQPHSFGSSSATYFAARKLAGRTSTVCGGGLPSANRQTTGASAARYASGGTAVLPSQTVLGTRPCRRT